MRLAAVARSILFGALSMLLAGSLAAQPLDLSRPIRFVTTQGVRSCSAMVDSVVADRVFVRHQAPPSVDVVPWPEVLAAWQHAGGSTTVRSTRASPLAIGIRNAGIVLAGISIANAVRADRNNSGGLATVAFMIVGASLIVIGTSLDLLMTRTATVPATWVVLPTPSSPTPTPEHERLVARLRETCPW